MGIVMNKATGRGITMGKENKEFVNYYLPEPRENRPVRYCPMCGSRMREDNKRFVCGGFENHGCKNIIYKQGEE